MSDNYTMQLTEDYALMARMMQAVEGEPPEEIVKAAGIIIMSMMIIIADGDKKGMKAGIEAVSRDMIQRVGLVEHSVYHDDLH